MECVIDQSALSEELANAQGSVEKKTTMPALGMIKISAVPEGYIILTSTDLEIGYMTRIPASIKTAGTVLLPARKLHEYVGDLPGSAQVQIKTTESRATLSCGRNTSRISLGNYTFPELPERSQPVATIPAHVLARSLSRVVNCVSMEDSRFTLNGALMVLSKTGITAVATDGHRLAICEHKLDLGDLNTEIRAILSRKGIGEIVKLATKSPDEMNVQLHIKDGHLYFTFENRRLYSRAVDGKFPDYRRILPNHEHCAVVGAAELREVITRVSRFADERSRYIQCSFASNQITFSAQNTDSGESEEPIDAEYNGPAFSIGANSQYVLDFLRHATGDSKVQIFVKDQNTQIELRIVGDETYRYIVMPMRLR